MASLVAIQSRTRFFTVHTNQLPLIFNDSTATCCYSTNTFHNDSVAQIESGCDNRIQVFNKYPNR